MTTNSATDYDDFRQTLREFALTSCPEEIRQLVASGGKITRHEYSTWQKILHAKGWGAPSWPVEFGGTGWDLKQRLIFEEVMAEAHCPAIYHHGVGHIGPVIIKFGTPEQHQRFLPRILDGSEWWCQGYSEPGSGSDLASLRSTAVLDGKDYVVNGQKMWTSHAHEADILYMLVRTSTETRKQDGISLLLVPLNTPGISIKPIKTIDGWHHVNEVFFTDVRVPKENLVGEAGRGWRFAKYLLERERLPPASVARLSLLWRRAKLLVEETIAQEKDRDLSSLRHRLLLIEGALQGAQEMLTTATNSLMRQEPLGMKPSALKIQCSEIAQRIVEIALDAAGPELASRFLSEDGQTNDEQLWIHNYLYFRARTIAGGTGEVQRNVVAREIFGE
jgi:alkylation response protein AidB-like acyl-CoA dehydrogenase